MKAVLTSGYDTSSFDREFWAKLSSDERLAAGWELAVQAHCHHGGKPSELRLQRSVALLKYGQG